MNEETKSRFTEYSLSSSVIRRNEQLTLLDDRFEKVNLVNFQLNPSSCFNKTMGYKYEKRQNTTSWL